MFHITSGLIGGLAAVTAWVLVAPVDAAKQTDTTQSQAAAASTNRAAKADRLAPPRPNGSDSTVATVEVVGIHDSAIVYRDRDGRVLFQTDPVSNVTVISKGFVLPQLTVRETARSRPIPIVAPHEARKLPAIPIGCDPIASPVAQPELAHLTGRCIVQRDDSADRATQNG
jgi:hypothetical protein